MSSRTSGHLRDQALGRWYKCKHCSRAFQKRRELRTHSKTHEGVVPEVEEEDEPELIDLRTPTPSPQTDVNLEEQADGVQMQIENELSQTQVKFQVPEPFRESIVPPEPIANLNAAEALARVQVVGVRIRRSSSGYESESISNNEIEESESHVEETLPAQDREVVSLQIVVETKTPAETIPAPAPVTSPQQDMFWCIFCEKICKDEKGRDRHESTHVKPFQCAQCTKDFSEEYCLRHHIADEHQPRFGTQRESAASRTGSASSAPSPPQTKIPAALEKRRRHIQAESEPSPKRQKISRRWWCSSCNLYFTNKSKLSRHEKTYAHLWAQRLKTVASTTTPHPTADFETRTSTISAPGPGPIIVSFSGSQSPPQNYSPLSPGSSLPSSASVKSGSSGSRSQTSSQSSSSSYSKILSFKPTTSDKWLPETSLMVEILRSKDRSDIRGYKCLICGFSYKSPVYAYTHFRSHSKNPRTPKARLYKCEECGISFPTTKALETHFEESHEVPASHQSSMNKLEVQIPSPPPTPMELSPASTSSSNNISTPKFVCTEAGFVRMPQTQTVAVVTSHSTSDTLGLVNDHDGNLLREMSRPKSSNSGSSKKSNEYSATCSESTNCGTNGHSRSTSHQNQKQSQKNKRTGTNPKSKTGLIVTSISF